MMSKLKKSLYTAITLFIIAALFILGGVFILAPQRTAHADTEEDHDHIYENGFCTVCGSEAPPLYWGINSTTGVLTLSSYESTAAPNLYSTIGEAPAWYNDRSDITSVTVDTYAYAPQDMTAWFYECENLTSVNLSNLDTSDVEMMSYAFYGCNSLTELDLSSFDTSNVYNMCEMFHGCSNLETLILPSSFVNSNVDQINGLFYDCSSLTSLDVSDFDTSNVTLMGGVFKGCNSLTAIDVSGFVTTKATDMSQLFYGCSSLTSLDVSNFNTANVKYTFDMFRDCSGLTELNLSSFDTSKVTDMKNMFKGCSALASLNVSSFDTSKVTYMSEMFKGCAALTSLNVSNFDTTNVEDAFDMFSGCDSLNEIQTPATVGTVALPLPCDYWNSDPPRGLIDEITSADVSTATEIKTIYRHADHNFAEGDDWTADANTHWHACKIGCGAVTDEAAHTYENGACTVCGTAADLYWKIDSEGVLTLSSFKRDEAFELYEDSTWENRKSEIKSVTVDTYAYAPVSISKWFSGCGNLTTADLTGLDTSRVTSMSSMFLTCTKLESVNLSDLDVSNVTNMGSMFFNCWKLTSLDLSGFHTTSLTNMYTMFENCQSLTSLTLSSSFNTENVTNMQSAFYGCSKLTSLDLSSFNAKSVTNMKNMFSGCNSLNTITVSDSLAQKLHSTSDDTNLYSDKNWYDGSGPAYTDSNRFNQGGTYTTVQPPFEVTVGTDITYYSTITGAWAAANNASAAATVKMYADAETAATLTVNSGKDITLDLNGCMLKAGEEGESVIEVKGTFTLKDTNTDTTKTHTLTDLNDTSKTITVTGGVITGGKGKQVQTANRTCKCGGGVFVDGGTFILMSGTISGNTAVEGSGVYVRGTSAKFTMTGGTISDNGDSTALSSEGGGVRVIGGRFEMSDGKITHNASGYGGGANVADAAEFEMTGGEISGNTARGNGGGLFIYYGTFKMSGGEISNNTASGYGGGVYVGNGGMFYVLGAPIITGNKVGNSENNVYLYNTRRIAVTGELDGAQIGVYNTGAVATGFTQDGDPSDYFIPDISTYNCVYVSSQTNGAVSIGMHRGGTATCSQKAHCANCGKEYGEVNSNNHVWNEGEITTQPTCIEEGVKTFTCTGCGATKTESVGVLGHDFSGEYEKDSEGHWHVCQRENCTVTDMKEDHSGGTATCSAKAVCSVCGGEHGETDSNNHAWNEGEITADPTCTEEGVKTFTCIHNSAHTKMESVEALGHDEVSHGAQAATCTETGWNAYVTCSRCDYTTKEEVPARGHTLTHTPETSATEEKEGNTEYWSCGECDKYFSDEAGETEISDKSSIVLPKLILPKHKDGGLSAGAKAGISVGVILLVLLVVYGVCYFELYRKEILLKGKFFDVIYVPMNAIFGKKKKEQEQEKEDGNS